MILDVPILRHSRVKLIVPIVVVLLLGYGDFAAFYSLGYQEIWKHHSKGNAIALWTLLAFCQITVFVYWAVIFIIGPGKAPTIQPFNLYNVDDPTLTATPDLFSCDESGYPYFNSQTSSIMVNRSFYSKDVNYNVLKFDHYCVWIGSVIGESNYVFFLKFMVWFLILFIVVLGHLIKFVPSNIHRGEINHNFIVLLFLCWFWILMISTLLAVHLRYVCLNITTLDEITINQNKAYARWESNKSDSRGKRKPPRVEKGKRYVNVKRGNRRYVVEYDVREQPYSKGSQANWINLMFNGNRNHGGHVQPSTWQFMSALVIFLIPYLDIPIVFRNRRRPSIDREIRDGPEGGLTEFENYSSNFSHNFVQFLHTKIDRNEFEEPVYMRRKSPASEISSTPSIENIPHQDNEVCNQSPLHEKPQSTESSDTTQ